MVKQLTRRGFVKLAGATGAAAAFAPFAGCLGGNTKSGLTLAYEPPALGQQSTYLVMKHKNFDEKVGFNLQGKQCTYGAEVVETYVAGNADIGQAGDFPALTAISKKEDSTIIGDYNQGKHLLALVGEKDSGVSLDTLEGKTIALPLGSTAEWFIREVIQDKTDLTPKDVEFMQAGPQAAITSLTQGEADAIVLWDPWIARSEMKYRAKTITFGLGTDYTCVAPIFASNKFIEQKEETVQKYMNAFVRAQKFVNEKTDQVVEWIANAEHGQVEKNIAKRALNVMLGRSEVADKNAIKPWETGYDEILQRAVDFRHNDIHPDEFPEMDVSKYIDTTYVKKAVEQEAPDLFGDIEF